MDVNAALARLAARFPTLAFCARTGPPTRTLTLDESAATADHVPHRLREFALGRECADEALRKLGFAGCSLPPHADGGVEWPDGVVGSITHKRNACLAVAGKSDGAVGLGIDLEWADDNDERLIDRITTSRERLRLSALSQRFTSPATVVFACKEAVYKAQFRLHGRELDWLDVEIEFDPLTARFRIATADAWSSRMAAVVEQEGNWIAALAIEGTLPLTHV